MRLYCPHFRGLQEWDYRKGDILNIDDKLAIECQHQQMAALGFPRWWEEQRGIKEEGGIYADAVGHVQRYLEGGHMRDGWANWYQLHAV